MADRQAWPPGEVGVLILSLYEIINLENWGLNGRLSVQSPVFELFVKLIHVRIACVQQ